jgi:CubicO group peptidase (beta-lactamase class C family)
LALLACAPLPARPAPDADESTLRGYLQTYIARTLRREHVVGASVAVVDGDRVLLSEGFGLADRENSVPVTADTVFRAASVSKPFTALAALKLAEEGRLRLDAPITKYLLEFSVRSRFGPPTITPRQLITHHAGFPTFYFKDFWRGDSLNDLMVALHEEELLAPPGNIHHYSNIGYDLLGLVIERITRERYAQYMREAILDPAGMSRSGFAPRPHAPAFVPKGYRDGKAVIEPPTGRDIPAGGLHTTANDLARFMRMMLAGGAIDGQRIARAETVAQMFQRQNAEVTLDLDQRIGLGWRLGHRDFDAYGVVASHSGATIVFRSRMTLMPEQRIGVAVLANSANAAGAINAITAESLRVLLAQHHATPAATATRPAPDSHPANAADYAGDYVTPLGIAEIRNGLFGLRAHVAGRAFVLRPEGDGMRLGYRALGFIPMPVPSTSFRLARISLESLGGENALVASIGNRRALIATRLEPVALSPAWLARIGAWCVANADEHDLHIDHVRIEREGKFLLFKLRLPDVSEEFISARALLPLDERRAVVAGVGQGMGEVLRVVDAPEGERLRYLGVLLERVK